MNNCICIICHRPNDVWLNFLNTFQKYDVYMIVDDNSINYSEHYSSYEKIKFIQIKDEDCDKSGIKNMSFLMKKHINGWDKSIYYFSTVNTSYDNVWFIEDDVFFYNEDTIINIDNKYTDGDLLSTTVTEHRTHNMYEPGYDWGWWWHFINIDIPLPYHRGMVCVVRMSPALLCKIKEYATTHNTLFFLEAMFPILCKKNDLIHRVVEDLQYIIFRRDYTIEDIDKTHMYHPVKDINHHIFYRNELAREDVTSEI